MRRIIGFAVLFLFFGQTNADCLDSNSTKKAIACLQNKINDLTSIQEAEKPVYVFPPYVIVMWGGVINDIPDGWALCDGTKNTPDLSDRFILATTKEVNGTQRTGGGEFFLTEKNIPLHSHNMAHGHQDNMSIDPEQHQHNYRRTDINGKPSDFFSRTNEIAPGDQIGLYAGQSVPTTPETLKITGKVSDHSGTTGEYGLQPPEPIPIVPRFYKLAFIMKLP